MKQSLKCVRIIHFFIYLTSKIEIDPNKFKIRNLALPRPDKERESTATDYFRHIV